MNHNFTFLVLGYFTCLVNRLILSTVVRCVFRVACASNSPTILPFHNVLVFP